MTDPKTEVNPVTGAHAVVAHASDPARRPDVLLRKRSDKEVNAWWMIGAFLVVSGGAVALLSLIPG